MQSAYVGAFQLLLVLKAVERIGLIARMVAIGEVSPIFAAAAVARETELVDVLRRPIGARSGCPQAGRPRPGPDRTLRGLAELVAVDGPDRELRDARLRSEEQVATRRVPRPVSG